MDSSLFTLPSSLFTLPSSLFPFLSLHSPLGCVRRSSAASLSLAFPRFSSLPLRPLAFLFIFAIEGFAEG